MDEKQVTTSPPEGLSIGEQFRLARQGLSLSLEEVAQKVGLRRSILQHIENNEFIQPAIPATFMQGYVRNYAKFLKLPEDLWQQIHYGEVEKNDLGKNARTKKAVNSHASHGRWLGYLTGLVVILVLGMTLLWWWENHQQSVAERDNLVESYVNATQSATSSNATSTIANNRHNEKPEALASQEPPTPLEATQTSAEVALNATSPPAEATAEQTENTLAQQINQVINPPSPTPSTAEVTSATEATNSSAILRIEVTQASCWISVKDENRKTLAEKEYKQGEILTFNQGERYSLIIGAPTNVKISYKGQDIPLKVDGRVARLSLPLS